MAGDPCAITVRGVWQNDGTAGLGLWCASCEEWWFAEDDDETTVGWVVEAEKRHRAKAAGRRGLMASPDPERTIVYTVTVHGGYRSGPVLIGVFSTLEKAQAARRDPAYEIEEWFLDRLHPTFDSLHGSHSRPPVEGMMASDPA